MKKLLFKSLLVVALLGVTVPAVSLLPGCKAPTAQAKAYATISSIEAGADGAYKAYLDQVVAGKVAKTAVRNVSQSYNLLQFSVRTAIAASRGNTNAPAPQAVLDAAANLTTAITTAKGRP